MDEQIALGGALMTTVEVMQRLGLSETELVAYRGRLGAIRCGDNWFFFEEAVAEFAERFRSQM